MLRVHLSSRFIAALGVLVLAAASATTAGCATVGPHVWVDEFLDDQRLGPVEYRLRSRDVLNISVWNQAQLSGRYVVREDGMITLPLVGDVAVSGLVPTAVSEQLAYRLQGLVVDPKVAVALDAVRAGFVSVIGEVRNPGRYELPDGATIMHVLALGGGLTEFASNDRIFVVRPHTPRVRFRFADLAQGNGRALEFILSDGDIVLVE